MNYDAIVTDAALREMFGYEILEGKVKMKRRKNNKTTKVVGPLQPQVLHASPAKKTLRKKERAKRKVPTVSKTPH
jgi:hypothetical protein